MDAIKEFDWNKASGSNERIAWLKENHNKVISESEYISAIRSLPHNHRRKSKCISPSNNRRKYYYLKEQFGFFGGKS